MKLQEFPVGICQAGLKRARWTRDNVGYLSYEEKNSGDGCPWGVLTEEGDSYCFFKMMANRDGQGFTEFETSYILGLTKDQVRRIQETAFLKLKNHPLFKELGRLHADGGLFEYTDRGNNDIYYSDSFNADGVYGDGVVEDVADILEAAKLNTTKKKPSK